MTAQKDTQKLTELERNEISQPCCCHQVEPAPNDASVQTKATPRSNEFQHDLQKRLNRIIGQLNGVKTMIDNNRYCGDVLTQLAAAEAALHSVSGLIMQNHMETCVVEKIREGDDAVIAEAMDLIRKFTR